MDLIKILLITAAVCYTPTALAALLRLLACVMDAFSALCTFTCSRLNNMYKGITLKRKRSQLMYNLFQKNEISCIKQLNQTQLNAVNKMLDKLLSEKSYSITPHNPNRKLLFSLLKQSKAFIKGNTDEVSDFFVEVIYP